VVSEYKLTRRVQFHETDAAGLVHFSCFFKYMEEAEHAMWRSVGLSIAPARAEIGWPRVAASFDYHKPLRFEDEFDAEIRIVAITEKTIRYSCVITRGGLKIATGAMTIACVKKGVEPLQSTAIPADIAGRFQVAAEGSEAP
jgi:acyl-CoA thioester hydrolase